MSDSVKFKIPAGFIAQRVRLQIAETAYGYRCGWIDAGTVVEVCLQKMDAGTASDAETDLALLLSDELGRVSEILLENTSDHDVDRAWPIWCYLALAWIYENRETLENVFAIVEMIYADFDYPREMEGIVGYMPPPSGAEAGPTALLARWKSFLDRKEDFYRSRKS